MKNINFRKPETRKCREEEKKYLKNERKIFFRVTKIFRRSF